MNPFNRMNCWYCGLDMDKHLIGTHMIRCVAEMVRLR